MPPVLHTKKWLEENSRLMNRSASESETSIAPGAITTEQSNLHTSRDYLSPSMASNGTDSSELDRFNLDNLVKAAEHVQSSEAANTLSDMPIPQFYLSPPDSGQLIEGGDRLELQSRDNLPDPPAFSPRRLQHADVQYGLTEPQKEKMFFVLLTIAKFLLKDENYPGKFAIEKNYITRPKDHAVEVINSKIGELTQQVAGPEESAYPSLITAVFTNPVHWLDGHRLSNETRGDWFNRFARSILNLPEDVNMSTEDEIGGNTRDGINMETYIVTEGGTFMPVASKQLGKHSRAHETYLDASQIKRVKMVPNRQAQSMAAKPNPRWYKRGSKKSSSMYTEEKRVARNTTPFNQSDSNEGPAAASPKKSAQEFSISVRLPPPEQERKSRAEFKQPENQIEAFLKTIKAFFNFLEGIDDKNYGGKKRRDKEHRDNYCAYDSLDIPIPPTANLSPPETTVAIGATVKRTHLRTKTLPNDLSNQEIAWAEKAGTFSLDRYRTIKKRLLLARALVIEQAARDPHFTVGWTRHHFQQVLSSDTTSGAVLGHGFSVWGWFDKKWFSNEFRVQAMKDLADFEDSRPQGYVFAKFGKLVARRSTS